MAALDVERFLRESWQRRPERLRGLFDAFEAPLSPEELAGLACEPEVESRIVVESEGWKVRHGPFSAEDFAALPEEGWSLLVHGVDRFVDGVAELLEPFRFLPNWRLDDVMVSYAPAGGSVGAHVDAYDVFLLQGVGTRRWSVESKPRAARDLVYEPDLEIELLKLFEPDQSWRCEPGDVVYLPPGHAHHGVALEPSMTYSIGLRAPAPAEIAREWLDVLAAHLPDGERYRDPGRAPNDDPGLLDDAIVETTARWCRDLGALDPERFVGAMLTRPRAAEEDLFDLEALGAPAEPIEAQPLRRSAPAHFAYRPHAEGLDLFVGGRRLTLEASALAFVRLLCGRDRLTAERLAAHPEHHALIAQLVAAGFLSPLD